MQSMDDYRNFLAEVRQLTGLKMLVPDDAGLVTLRVEDKYNLSLQYVEASGRILVFVEVTQLPKDAPKSVYRDLLAGALFGQDTAGGYFTLEAESETVVYNYFVDGNSAAKDPDDFVSTLERILQLCDLWADRIQGNLAEAQTPDAVHPAFGGGIFA